MTENDTDRRLRMVESLIAVIQERTESNGRRIGKLEESVEDIRECASMIEVNVTKVVAVSEFKKWVMPMLASLFVGVAVSVVSWLLRR